MLGHPSKPELLAYAEGLVDGRGISAATARHITSCPVCASRWRITLDEMSPAPPVTSTRVTVADRSG